MTQKTLIEARKRVSNHLYEWHAGGDCPIHVVASHWFSGHETSHEQVEACIHDLRYLAEAPSHALDDSDRKELSDLADEVSQLHNPEIGPKLDPNTDYEKLLKEICTKYDGRIRTFLAKIIAALQSSRACDIETSEVVTDFSDDHRWEFVGSTAEKPFEREEYDPNEDGTAFDVTLEICEQRSFEGADDGRDNPNFGINFGLNMVSVGGAIIGGITPHNFTDDVWIDARDPDEVEQRFRLIEEASIPSIVETVEGFLQRNSES